MPSSSHARFAVIATFICAPGANAASWNGQGETGYVMARGNADTDTGNIKLNLATQGERWNNTVSAAAIYGRSNETTSAERWDARWQTDYKLDHKPFVFGAMRHEQDRFSGFDFQSTLSAGAGYQFLETERVQLSASLGAGYRRLRPQQLIKDETGNIITRVKQEETADAVANASVNYKHQLTETTTLISKLVVESGTDNTFAQNDLSLQVAMTEKLAVGLGYGVRHNTEPPVGLGETDQLATANLVYRFK